MINHSFVFFLCDDVMMVCGGRSRALIINGNPLCSSVSHGTIHEIVKLV